MLKELRLHNFRTYLNAEFSFTQRHLLIGANNSGKTNLCAALRFLGMTTRGDLPSSALVVPGGIGEIKNWAFKSNTVDFFCRCELPIDGQPHEFEYELSLNIESSGVPSQEGHPVLRVARERLIFSGTGFRNVTLVENDGNGAQVLQEDVSTHAGSIDYLESLAPPDATVLSKLYSASNRRAASFRQYLAGWAYYALSPGAMRDGWRDPSAAQASLESCGGALANVLFRMKNMDEQRYRRVVEHVRLIEPDLEAINFIPAPDQGAVPFVALRNQPRASWHGLSDGTLRCLALATIVELVAEEAATGLQSPRVVIIEEPENGIYPGQLRAFFDLLEDRTPRGQFLFTSHSPYFINFFDGCRESVTLLRRNKERTEVLSVPPAEDDPDRPLLAEQYSMGLLD